MKLPPNETLVPSTPYEEDRKKKAQCLIDYSRCFDDGYVYGYKIAKDDTDPCGDCPSREVCGASLNLLCVYAQSSYYYKCVKEKLFYHQIQLVRIS